MIAQISPRKHHHQKEFVKYPNIYVWSAFFMLGYCVFFPFYANKWSPIWTNPLLPIGPLAYILIFLGPLSILFFFLLVSLCLARSHLFWWSYNIYSYWGIGVNDLTRKYVSWRFISTFVDLLSYMYNGFQMLLIYHRGEVVMILWRH